MHSGRNLEKMFHRRTEQGGQHHAHRANSGVTEQSRVDELRKLFTLPSGRVLGNVANDRGTDAEIEQTVVSGNGENQDPDSERRIAQAMEDKRGKKNADDYVDSERGPARSDVLQDLRFFVLSHPLR